MIAGASPVFDHLVYGWAPTGREGRNRFQVVACSEGFAKSLDGQGRLAVLAQQLCYLNDRHDPGAVSLGWVPSPLGLFLFRREPTGPDSWGRSGGFCANVLHCAGAVGVEDAMALLRSDVWVDLQVAVAAGPDLPQVYPVEPPPLVTPRPACLPAFIQAALDSFDDQRPIRLSMPWAEALDTMAYAVDALPIAPFVRRGFSTYEASTVDADRFGICGMTVAQTAASSTQRLVATSSPNESDIGNLTVAGGPCVSEAIELAAGGDNEFSPGAYAAVLRVVTGNAAALDPALVSSLLKRSSAASLAFEQPGATTAIIDAALADWSKLGADVLGTMRRLSPATQESMARALAGQFVTRVAADGVAPDVFGDLGHAGSGGARTLISSVVDALRGRPELARVMPRNTVGVLAASWPIDRFDDPVRLAIRDAAFDCDVVRSISGELDERLLVDLFLTSVDRRDERSALHLAGLALPGQEQAIGRGLGSRLTWEDDLSWLLGIASSTSDTAVWALVGQWARDRTLDSVSATARVYRARSSAPDQAIDDLLALDRSRQLPHGSRLRAAAARIAADVLPAVIDGRVQSGRDEPIGHRELQVLQTFSNDDVRLAYWASLVSFVRKHLAEHLIDVRSLLRTVDKHNALVDPCERLAADTVVASLVIRQVRSAQDAQDLVDWFTDRPGIERSVAVGRLVTLVWAPIGTGAARARTERTRLLVEALADATRRRFRGRVILDPTAATRLRFLLDTAQQGRRH